MSDPVSYRLEDGIAVITLDDGKANAISHAVLEGLDRALDEAERDARAVVLVGREGKFSAGFDLAAMTASDESMRALVIDGATFLMRLYGLGLPTVAACTGHALAAGFLVLLASDVRIGTDQPAKIGLNEVAIGMALPIFAVEMARDRLAPAHLTAATMGARIYDPAGAMAAGYLDQIVPAAEVLPTVMAEAAGLATLRTGAYARTKQAARSAAIAHILATLVEDMSDIGAPKP